MNISIKCAWCHKDLGIKQVENTDDSQWVLPVTHSICTSCYQKLCAEKNLIFDDDHKVLRKRFAKDAGGLVDRASYSTDFKPDIEKKGADTDAKS